ncbi:MAG TPA: TonB-dependent receptor, partial [Longimicrobiales bacterium]|nr:TonB-dependent receptor [Longimicrobiales bacterium]
QWSLNTQHDWRSYDEPGPLADTELAGSRSQSSPFYRFDHATERFHRLGVDVSTALSRGSRFSGYLTGEYRHSDRVRTLALAPTFADTKNRVLTGQRMLGSVHLYVPDAPILARDELVLGVDASIGRIKSSYYNFGQGTPDMYSGAAFTRGELDAKGSATRSAAAGFLRYNVDVAESLRLSAGARLDWLHDRFDPSDSIATTASHLVLSPGVGVNLRLSSASAHEAHLFANITRSFKAPTPDQLFDQRGIPVPFPPFRITFANRDLRPQHGVSFEAGLYQRAQLAGALTANLSLAAYQTDLRDELDFDVATFRYENIGRSRHRGIEAGVALHGPGLLSGFTNYTWQAATARAGEHEGKYLKALPRHFIVAGVSAGRTTGFLASISATTARTMYVDDANTRRLPDWTRWDARLSYGLRAWQLYLDVFNLADAEYSTTGFPDPAGSDVVYYYPAAGRTLELGVRWQR